MEPWRRSSSRWPGDKYGKNVVLMASSDLGRRVKANGAGGTDHGTADPMFVAGGPVRRGFYGDEPSLTDLDNGDLKPTTDSRRLLRSVVQDAGARPDAIGRDRPAKPRVPRLAAPKRSSIAFPPWGV